MKATYWISIVVVGTAILGGGYGWATRSTHYRTPDYTQLEALLATQQWDAADQETTRLMRDIAFDATTPDNAFGHSWLQLSGSVIVEDFPCQELRQIDVLWREASGDRFGFTPQANIWHQINPDLQPYSFDFDAYDVFQKQIGWMDDDETVAEKPTGYYPSSDWMQAIFQTGEPWMEMGRVIYDKLPTCP
jgi:hypothetical protein